MHKIIGGSEELCWLFSIDHHSCIAAAGVAAGSHHIAVAEATGSRRTAVAAGAAVVGIAAGAAVAGIAVASRIAARVVGNHHTAVAGVAGSHHIATVADRIATAAIADHRSHQDRHQGHLPCRRLPCRPS